MEALVTAVVLSIALASSGIWRSLVSLSSPRARRSGATRAKGPKRPVFRRVPGSPRAAKSAPARPRARRPAPPAARPSEAARPVETASERSQLRQLAERLARLESALDVGDVHLSPRVMRSPSTSNGPAPWTSVDPTVASVESTELSRAERELMKKMGIGRA